MCRTTFKVIIDEKTKITKHLGILNRLITNDVKVHNSCKCT